MAKQDEAEMITRYADMFSAMGTEPRLKIMRLLLSAYPEGMVVSEIGSELEIPNSTLSHHLEKLKNEDLVKVRREGTYLWYSANADRAAGAARLPLCGMLHPEQGDRAAEDCLLQMTKGQGHDH